MEDVLGQITTAAASNNYATIKKSAQDALGEFDYWYFRLFAQFRLVVILSICYQFFFWPNCQSLCCYRAFESSAGLDKRPRS